MKKLLFFLLAVTAMFSSCEKDVIEKRPTGPAELVDCYNSQTSHSPFDYNPSGNVISFDIPTPNCNLNWEDGRKKMYIRYEAPDMSSAWVVASSSADTVYTSQPDIEGYTYNKVKNNLTYTYNNGLVIYFSYGATGALSWDDFILGETREQLKENITKVCLTFSLKLRNEGAVEKSVDFRIFYLEIVKGYW